MRQDSVFLHGSPERNQSPAKGQYIGEAVVRQSEASLYFLFCTRGWCVLLLALL